MNNTTMHKTLLAIAIGAVTHSAFAADEKKRGHHRGPVHGGE